MAVVGLIGDSEISDSCSRLSGNERAAGSLLRNGGCTK